MNSTPEKDDGYENNRKHWLAEEEKIYELWEKAENPGGQKQIDRLKKQGKKPVRELIRQLVDVDTEFFELSRGAGFGLNYETTQDVPSAGLATGLGKVHGKWVMVIANDSRVKAGAANYGMCGRAYEPRFIFNTMRGRTSVMSGSTAGHILTTLERANAKRAGKEMDEAALEQFEKMMVEKYTDEAHPFYNEARLYHEGTLPFKACRDALATAFEVSLLKPIQESHFGNFKF